MVEDSTKVKEMGGEIGSELDYERLSAKDDVKSAYLQERSSSSESSIYQ